MTIFSNFAWMMLKEHCHRPFSGKLLSIGRQSVSLTTERLRAMIEAEGIAPRSSDTPHIDDRTRFSAGRGHISDVSMYSMFSDVEYQSMDVSDYEGATIIHDLCDPVPAELENQFDIIINGSCLDNLFDPAMALKNMSRMLKPHGRVLHMERSNRVPNAYIAFSAAWFHDYYAINEFADCKAYLVTWSEHQEMPWDIYLYRPLQMQDDREVFFGRDNGIDHQSHAHLIVIAERGADSTSDRAPIQFDYRSRTQQPLYIAAERRFQASSRPIVSADVTKKITTPLIVPTLSSPRPTFMDVPTFTFCGRRQGTGSL